eukprot:TRINITY_DN6924_c0_g1_i1.p1 TRINITY_DN6924_c0_g1~~TRINITY_DN6924_c0_g1_i1.p1  ORF type:complete len:496 (+),score=113.46 TRINITY_DN6924_c0_g1_i1:137-1489(+)
MTYLLQRRGTEADKIFKHIATIFHLIPDRESYQRDAPVATLQQLHAVESSSGYLQMIVVCLMSLTAMGVTLLLEWLSDVLVPLALAAFCYCLLAPVSDCIRRCLRRWGPSFPTIDRAKVHRWRAMVAATLTLIFAFVSIAAVFYILVRSITDVAGHFKEYWDYIQSYSDLTNSTSAEYNRTLVKLGLRHDGIVVRLMSVPGISQTLQASLNEGQLAKLLATVAGDASGMLTPFAVTVFVALYLLHFRGVADGHRLLGLRKDTAERGLSETLIVSIETRMYGYFKQKTVSSIIQGVLSSITYRLLDLPLCYSFGLVHFFANWIPIAGPVLACMIPLPIALLTCDCLLGPLVALVFPILVHVLLSNVVEQWLMKELLGPIEMIACLVFWFRLWGLGGLVLSVPITSALKMAVLNDRSEAPDLDFSPAASPLPRTNAGKDFDTTWRSDSPSAR